MSLARLEEHRELWATKPVLTRVYGVWFDAILAQVDGTGTVVEVGAGPGFLAGYARDRRSAGRWLSCDVVATPWNDVVADGLALPFRSGSVAALVALDLLHHLARPRDFFREAARVLRPGDRVVAIEPWITPFSYPIYRWLHQEGCTLGLDPWDPFSIGGVQAQDAKDPFDGDAGVVHALARRVSPRDWHRLGFETPSIQPLNGFAYLLSLGFKRGCLLSPRAVPFMLGLDRVFQPLATLVGLRALLVWQRRAEQFEWPAVGPGGDGEPVA